MSGINSSEDALTLEQSFWTTKSALFASGIGVGFLFIPTTFGSRLLTLRKMDCYLLTVKDRFNKYKSFYLFSYIGIIWNVVNMLIVSAILYAGI